MAAMLVDLPFAPQGPAPLASGRWVHVDSPRPGAGRPATAPQARSVSPTRPGGRPRGVAAPQVSRRAAAPAAAAGAAAPAALRLTRRGLAVVMGGFALVMVTALVVLVTAFLAVPNEPLGAQLLLG